MFYTLGTRYGRKAGNVDWLKENFCTHCQETCSKGLLFCPRCRLKCRITPHNHAHTRAWNDFYRKAIKQAQEEAYQRLKGLIMPPPCVSAK